MTSEQSEIVFHRADLQLRLPRLAPCGGDAMPCDNSENIYYSYLFDFYGNSSELKAKRSVKNEAKKAPFELY